MINIAINYDEKNKTFKIFEPTTDTIILSSSLSETLLKLNEFLVKNSLIPNINLLDNEDITYHIDTGTMKAMVLSNIKLLKRLDNSPSGFCISSQRFQSTGGNNSFNKNKKSNFSKGSNEGSSNSESERYKRNRSRLSGAKGFSDSFKKFGGI